MEYNSIQQKQRKMVVTLCAAAMIAIPSMRAGSPTETESVAPDKSGYTLFNPTPIEQRRELSPDRPDATESPITLDAGAYGVEISYFDWRRDNGDNSYTVMATNFKIGLTNDIDLQTVFDAYTWEDPETGKGGEGFSDVQIRLKWNLWGNDEEGTALALFPYIKVPTGTELSNGEVEGGLIIPFSVGLTDRVGLGLMAEIDAVYDEETRNHGIEFLHSAVVGVDLTDQFGAFFEYIGITGENTRYQSYAAGGLTFQVSDDLILDCGTQVGLNENSEDLGVFAGFTKRF